MTAVAVGRMPAGPANERPVVVAIGASNLSRGLARLVAAVRRRAAGADLLAAAGHGRSYGAASRVAWRRLPAVLRCGLWRAVERLDPGGRRPLRAVVTDIGNDLLYGFSVDQTAAWVRECVARLADRGATVAITSLPLESVLAAGPLQDRLLRTVFVPGCPLSLAELQSAARQLDDAVRSIAGEHSATLIEQPGAWYGFDSIHVRRHRLDDLWATACSAWGLPEPAGRPRVSLALWAGVGRQAAEVRSLAELVRFTRQPVLRWPEGGSLSVY